MLFYLSGWAGLALILLFTINAAFSGTRLGLCWMMLEERYEEFRKEIRDPYPSIGEKAVGRLVTIPQTSKRFRTFLGSTVFGEGYSKPPRTPRISGLKSQILKPTLLS